MPSGSASLCGAIGCEVVFEEVLPGRPNVIASLHRDDAYPTLVIEGHTDTVGGALALRAEDRRRPPRRARCVRHEGRHRGRAARARAAGGDRHPAERPLRGHRRRGGGIRGRHALRADTTRAQTRRSCSSRPRSCPSSRTPACCAASCGPRALQLTARRRSSARTRSPRSSRQSPASRSWAEQREPSEHELCGRTSFSVTTIRGGSGINTIPAECVAEFDWRLHPSDDPESARVELVAHLAESAPASRSPPSSLRTAVSISTSASPSSRRRAPPRRVAGRSHRSSRGHRREQVRACRHLRRSCSARARWRRPTPPDEWIEIEEIARAAELYVELSRSRCADAVIDGHVHVFREGSEPFPGDAPVEDLLATMKSHGVTQAVLVGLSATG